MDDTRHVDGNALAGPLSEIFAGDTTALVARCGGCDRVAELATLRVYTAAPGLVARCPGCRRVTLRLVRDGSHTWLDLSGLAYLRMPTG